MLSMNTPIVFEVVVVVLPSMVVVVLVEVASPFATVSVNTAVSPGMRISGDSSYDEIMTAGSAEIVGIKHAMMTPKIQKIGRYLMVVLS